MLNYPPFLVGNTGLEQGKETNFQWVLYICGPMRWFRARWWQCHALSVWQCSNKKSTWQLQVASCFNVWHCRYQFFIWKHFFCACEYLVPIISFSPVFSLIVVFHRPNMVYFSIHPGKFQTFAKHIGFFGYDNISTGTSFNWEILHINSHQIIATSRDLRSFDGGKKLGAENLDGLAARVKQPCQVKELREDDDYGVFKDRFF